MSTQTPSHFWLHHRSTFGKSVWLLLVAFTLGSCQMASLYLADAERAASNGNYRKAVELSTRAIAADSSSFEAWNARGFWSVRLSDYTNAATDLTTAIALQPSRTVTYYNRIAAWLALQQPDSAIADYSTLLVLNPYNLSVQMARAQLYDETGQYQKAIEDYEIVLAFNPYHYWAYNGQAMAYQHLQQYDKAIENCDQAVNTVLELIEDIKNTGANRHWAPKWKDNTPEYAKQAARQNAIARYEKNLSQLVVNRAVVYAAMDSIDLSIEEYRKALAWDSTNATAYGNMGWMYYEKGDFPACVRLSELAIRHDGRAMFARFNRAVALLRLGNIQQAQEAYGETMDYSAFLLHKGDYADSTDTYIPPSLVASMERARQGAIEDVRDLVRKNIQAEEARTVLREIFHVEQQDMP